MQLPHGAEIPRLGIVPHRVDDGVTESASEQGDRFMIPVPVSTIIKIDDPSQYKLHVARWNGSDQPLDVYVRDKNEW